MKKELRNLRKDWLGEKGAKDKFQNYMIDDLTIKEGEMVRDFWNYCHSQIKCVRCNHGYDGYKAKGSYDLKLKCELCLNIETLSDPETQRRVKQFDDFLYDKAGGTFEDGFPMIGLPDFMTLNKKKDRQMKGTFNL